MKTIKLLPWMVVLAAGAAQAQSDARFIREAAIGNMTEIQLGRLARDRGVSEFTRKYGEMMVADHQMALNELELIAEKRGVTLPTDIDAPHKAMVRKMTMLNGARFDSEYRQMMIADHKEDLALFRNHARYGSVEHLREYAMMYAPVIEKHLFYATEGKM
ncbi:MAG: DUF4142 domain-containing protein [Armatimonadetes bacterium]|nr:DUF4142 domain-containing protein [Armatimonadota bacterium]